MSARQQASNEREEKNMQAIEADNLTKSFGGFMAVDHISFSVKQGEIFGLLGPNGAGKTTIIRMLCTLLLPTEGTARVMGSDVVKEADEVRQRIGVVTEKLIMYDRLTPTENLKVFGKLYDIPSETLEKRIEELLKLVDLWDWRNHRVSDFSSGMRQRLNIVRAMLQEPEILFLDEPTLGLDPTTAHNIRRFVQQTNKKGVTVFLTTHYMDEADQLSARIGIIDWGKIIAIDTPKNLKESVSPDATLEDVFIKLTGEKMRDAPKKRLWFTFHRHRRHFG